MKISEMIKYLENLKAIYSDLDLSYFLEGSEPKKIELLSVETIINKEHLLHFKEK